MDKRRVVVAGHSCGGQLTLLEAAGSWDGSPELRDRLIETLSALPVPVMLIQAANDYSLSPSSAMERELSRLSKPYVRKIFDRYKDCGLTALTDRSRRPYRQANRLPAPIEAAIVR